MSMEEKKELINNVTGEMDDSLLDEVSGGRALGAAGAAGAAGKAVLVGKAGAAGKAGKVSKKVIK